MSWFRALWLLVFALFITWIVQENAYQASPEGKTELQQQYVDRLGERVEYMKDMSTGICFAYMDSAGPHGLGFATVDCDLLHNVTVMTFSSPVK
jgi:hypothetical protein